MRTTRTPTTATVIDDRDGRRGWDWIQLGLSFQRHTFTEGIALTAATGVDVDIFVQGR